MNQFNNPRTYKAKFTDKHFAYVYTEQFPNFQDEFLLMTLLQTDIVKFYHTLPELLNKKYKPWDEILEQQWLSQFGKT